MSFPSGHAPFVHLLLCPFGGFIFFRVAAIAGVGQSVVDGFLWIDESENMGSNRVWRFAGVHSDLGHVAVDAAGSFRAVFMP